jgi:hypothetical protein
VLRSQAAHEEQLNGGVFKVLPLLAEAVLFAARVLSLSALIVAHFASLF